MSLVKVVAPFKGAEEFRKLEKIFLEAGIHWTSTNGERDDVPCNEGVLVSHADHRLGWGDKEFYEREKEVFYKGYTFKDLLGSEETKYRVEPASSAGVNPKQSIGASKLPLNLWSPLASAYGSLGLLNGQKYGFGNYKATPVILSIYIAAMLRHLHAFNEGQECDPVDGTPHLSAILANVAIILEARATGMLVDDRPIQGGYLKEVDELTKIAQKINEFHKDRNAYHYTIKDNPEDAIK